ncbi:unnamed protein product, partial [Staurois parvus]
MGNRGSWGPCVLAHTQTTPKKAYERYQGHLMGPLLTPGPWAVPEFPNGQSATAPHKFSIGLRSGDWAGHSITSILLVWNQDVARLLVC